MDRFKLTVSTPEKRLFEGEAESVTVPGEDGQFTILVGHAPLLSTLVAGKVMVADGSGEKIFEIGSGFIEVNEDGATILAKEAPAEEKPTDDSE